LVDPGDSACSDNRRGEYVRAALFDPGKKSLRELHIGPTSSDIDPNRRTNKKFANRQKYVICSSVPHTPALIPSHFRQVIAQSGAKAPAKQKTKQEYFKEYLGIQYPPCLSSTRPKRRN
jgi:hypothetical protein